MCVFLKLRCVCINPVFTFGNNQLVLWNTSVPESMLKKKSNLIAYYFVREGAARKGWITSYIKKTMSLSDMLTKALQSGENRKQKVRQVLYDIYPVKDEAEVED